VKKSNPVRTYVRALIQRYKRAKKKVRGEMLDEFVSMTGYSRKHAMAILSRRYKPKPRPIRRRRQGIYTDEDRRAVRQLAAWFDEIGSQRLRVAMDQELARLRACGHLGVSDESYARLQRISPATMDRLRAQHRVPGRRWQGGTKPGTLLRSQVPIRTFADWDDKRVGFVEIDLVQHEGGSPHGIFACTLHITDVSTGWCEPIAVENKAQKRVFAALKTARQRLPFTLLGIDSDNGSAFINAELIRYCNQEKLTFTRGRVGRKNDNAFVEQKNYSVVRRLVGYDRYDRPQQVKLLNALYERYRLYVNFFMPVTKLIEKQRVGHRVRKIYDTPKTPYQRVLDSPDVSNAQKARLRALYATLDVVSLRRDIDALLDRLKPSQFGEDFLLRLHV
jgi:hypothetical protein